MEEDEIIVNVKSKPNNNLENKRKKSKRLNQKKSVKENNDNKNTINKKSNNKGVSNKKNSNSSKKEARTMINTKDSNKGIIFKVIIILALIIGVIIFLCSSSLFNIKSINITGNEKLSENKIISLSGLEIDTNMFRFNKSQVIKKIKENAYIEEVKISRKLPNTIQINIEERETTYMLQFADSYVYINNQGYMLDISNEKLPVPIIVGFLTDLNNIKAGNRIDVEDLKKMEMIIKIYEEAKINQLNELITKIDVSDTKNFTLILEGEGKTVYLGDGSDLNTRMLCLKSILEANQGRSGEIFLNVDLNSKRVYFRRSTE